MVSAPDLLHEHGGGLPGGVLREQPGLDTIDRELHLVPVGFQDIPFHRPRGDGIVNNKKLHFTVVDNVALALVGVRNINGNI